MIILVAFLAMSAHAALPPGLAESVETLPEGCSGLLTRVKLAMGTRAVLRLCPSGEVALDAAARDALAEIDRLERLWADRIFDWFRQACPARRGARRLAKSAVACTWTTPLEDGWRSDERGECRSGQLLNHDDDELAPNPSQAPRGRESGRTGAFTSAEPLSGGPRLSR